MDLSIIIVNFNTKKLTLDCINSVIKERSNIKYEIIVVDNGSTDGSVVEISNFKSRISNLRLVANKTNLGFAKANNQGIKIAKGKYILLLNSDTVVKKGVFKKLIDCAKDHSDSGVVVPQLLNTDGSIQPSCFKFPTIGRAIRQYWFNSGKSLDKYSPANKNLLPTTVDVSVMAAFLITPKGLKEVGLLDERYFMYFEDFEYCRQVKKKGLKIYYIPRAQVVHIHGGSSMNDSNSWRKLIPSSKIYHGLIKHYIFNFILWSGQKFKKAT